MTVGVYTDTRLICVVAYGDMQGYRGTETCREVQRAGLHRLGDAPGVRTPPGPPGRSRG